MQFKDRELLYTERVCGSRSLQTERSVRKTSPSHNENEIFQVPLMRCNLRFLPLITRVKYSSPTHEMQFTDRELFYTDRI